MGRVVESIGKVAVELELKGQVPPRQGPNQERLPGREYGLVLGAIQEEFQRLVSVTIAAGEPIRYTVLPIIGETLESLLERAKALQARAIESGIVAS